MIKAERQDKVRQLLEEQGTVSVKEISDALGVSDMTIRRDLEELASLGEIERVHGGARSAQGRPHAMLRHDLFLIHFAIAHIVSLQSFP